jgi:transmembrane sensor
VLLTRINQQIADQAATWLQRQDAMAAADWHSFVEWLEADPRHAEAYDRLAMADHLLGEMTPLGIARPLPEPANDRGHAGLRWSRWLGGAAVAAAAMSAVVVMRPAAPDIYALETKPGEQMRQIKLDDGSRMDVAGGSRVLLDRNNPRMVTLERGDALFHVRHDEARPFTVRSGKLEVRDVGTVFNVTRDGSNFVVEVAEGEVLFQPEQEAVALKAGAALSVREDRREVRVGRIEPNLVGGWRTGRLTFTDAPVSQVVRTVERLYGTKLVANDDLSSRPVTGIISLSGEAVRDVPHIASMIGARWRIDGERWILSPVEEEQP